MFTATLGENQDTSKKRIESHKKGYLCGSLDLIINSLHKHYTGFAIEFENPKGNGVLSDDQSKMLRQYQNNGFKTLVSNDYDYIIEQLIEFFRDVKIKCLYCSRKYISSLSIKNYITSFHKKIKKYSIIYMDNQKVKKEKVWPYFYKTEEERKDAIRRSKPVTCFRKFGIAKYAIVSIVKLDH